MMVHSPPDAAPLAAKRRAGVHRPQYSERRASARQPLKTSGESARVSWRRRKSSALWRSPASIPDCHEVTFAVSMVMTSPMAPVRGGS